jgi:hypothetical protein
MTARKPEINMIETSTTSSQVKDMFKNSPGMSRRGQSGIRMSTQSIPVRHARHVISKSGVCDM